MVFLNFFALFLEFSITRWVGTKRNETERQYLFCFFLDLFQPILALNEAIMVFFNFFNFFPIFFGIFNYALGRDGTKL